jgi:hypothetical protein
VIKNTKLLLSVMSLIVCWKCIKNTTLNRTMPEISPEHFERAAEQGNVTRDIDGSYLADRYVNNKILEGKMDEGGSSSKNLGWTFFQGRCHFDKETGVEIGR